MDRSVAFRIIAATASLLIAAATADQGDPERGAKLFRQCAACHSVEPGRHLTGPSLAKVWGSRAGADESFRRYSKALKASTVTWDAPSLDRWLEDPQAFIAGNEMAFRGIGNAQARRDLVAYLEAVSQGAAPAAAGGRGGAGMGRAGPADLRTADPDSQVVSMTHCGDTYTVETADGRRHRIWEFNLRLKADSSELGPAPGKPVIVGSGMMGDRASIVFSKPLEISPFIKARCE